MAQAYSCLAIHAIFGTKERKALISDSVRERLHAYMGAILKDSGCKPILINSVEDHAHVLFELSRSLPLSQAMEDIKKHSSRWIKTQGTEFGEFAW
jgi:REP element-mobilizing transposase RayT